MAAGKLINGDEEKILKQILNAEDKKLDREWHEKVCKTSKYVTRKLITRLQKQWGITFMGKFFM